MVDTASENQQVGVFTRACRVVCCAMVAAPLLYWWVFGYKGNAYIGLYLALQSPIAGVVLVGNSLFCLGRYRGRRQAFISLSFILISVVGVVALPYVLPGFKM